MSAPPGPLAAVVGARGKTGRAVADALSDRGASVVPVGRDELRDPVAALSGADLLYVIAPNMHEDEPGLVSDVLDAARVAGVRRVGYHSVAAPYAPSMPHHRGKAVAEDVVRRCGLEWTVLQPCAYMQNFVPSLRSADPEVRVAYSPRSVFGLVDLVDVGLAAAEVLLSRGHVGATYELGGPALVSAADVAVAAAHVLGREVPVSHVSADRWRDSSAAGADGRVRDWLAAMFDYYDAYGLPTGALPLTSLLGRAPTSLTATVARELSGPGRVEFGG